VNGRGVSALCALVAVCAACGCGSGESPEARTAHAWLAAVDAAETATRGKQDEAQAEAHALIAEVAHNCPGVLADGRADPLREEAADALEIARRRPSAGILPHFAATVGHLHFDDPRATQELREDERSAIATAALALPNLCADAHAWVRAPASSTAAQGGPPGTERVEKEVAAARPGPTWLPLAAPHLVPPGESLYSLRRRYETPAERRTREAHFKAPADSPAARWFVHDLEELDRDLGLSPT
jgi:hypothetical protein